MSDRFSKATLAAWAKRRIDIIQRKWVFDPSDGTDQLLKRNADSEMARAYGEWEVLIDMIDRFDLPEVAL